MHYDAKVTARLKKIEGQLRGVLGMMEKEQECKAVITQLSAVRSAVDRAIGVIVTENLVECISDESDVEAINLNKDVLVKQAIDLLLKSR